MSNPDSEILRLHDDRDYFLAAVQFTARATGFAPRLIEKDCLCTALLQYLAADCPELVFKGGTCLAKIHAGFYRLSEDLDFTIPLATATPRAQRSKRAQPLKDAVEALPQRLPLFQIAAPLTGSNNSTQYNAVITYTPLTGGGSDTIKIEAGLREPLLLPASDAQANTILLNPTSDQPQLPPVPIRSIAKLEAFAEKFRAALSRREVAVRDFFDLDYAVRQLGLQPANPDLAALVRSKLAVPGNEPVDMSEARLAQLRLQLAPQLQPVLRPKDFAAFDLDRAFQLVSAMADRLR